MEDHSTYTEQITLDEGDVDYRGRMKPSALLRCAEHMATAHAWSLGMDKAFYAARHMVYLVGRQALEFYRPPVMRETVVLTTYPEKNHRGANKRVLVVRSGSTPRKMVENSVQLLRRAESPLLGIVLNRADVNNRSSAYYHRYYHSSYYYKGYRGGYGYGHGSAHDKSNSNGGK